MTTPAASLPTSPPPQAFRNPREAQRGLQGDTRDFLRAVDSIAYDGNGDAKFWMNRAEYMAFRAASFAATSTLSVQAWREDPPDLREANAARIRQADGALRGLADRWAGGYGDAPYWFERCKGLSIESAVHAATVASMCDGALAASVSQAIRKGLDAADGAHAGSGDAHYWSGRTANLARDLKGSLGSLGTSLPGDSPATAAPGALPGPFQADLERLNSDFGREVQDLIFGKTGGASDWMFRAEHIGARATAYAAEKTMLVGGQRTDTPEERDAALQQMAEVAKRFGEAADRLATGSGDADFWCKRAVALTQRGMECANDLAAACDAPLLRGARPLLEEVLQRSERAGYGGSGDARYWMERVSEAGEGLKFSARSVLLVARAEAAAEAVAPPAGAQWSEEVSGLEAEVARQTVLRDGWKGVLDPVRAALPSSRAQRDALLQKAQPLREKDRALAARQRWAGLASLGGGVGFLAGLAATRFGVVGAALMAGGGALWLGANLVKTRFQRQRNEVAGELGGVEQQARGLDSAIARNERVVQVVGPRAEAAERELQAAGSRLAVIRLAEGAHRPDEGSVDVGEEEVTIGGVTVPRRKAG